MDVKSAFNNVGRGHLVERMTQLEVENDLARWAESFMSHRKVRLCINGQEGADRPGGQHWDPPGLPGFTHPFYHLRVWSFQLCGDRVPGVKALSFVDDVAWLVEDKDEDSLSARLEEATTVAQEWANANAVCFDTSKTEAVVLSGRRRTNTANARGIQVGDKTVHFNKHATRWLGVWLDSKLTLKEHHDTRLKIARNAQNKLRRIAGQAVLSPENCRRVQVASVQAAALFRSELWLKGDGTHDTQGDVRRLVAQEAGQGLPDD